MKGKLISLAIGAALLSANAVAGDFKYRGFDDRHDRREQRYERHDGGHGPRYSGRRHWAPSEHPRYHNWRPHWNHHRHEHYRWCNHWVPPHHAYAPDYFDGGSSITFILRSDLD